MRKVLLYIATSLDGYISMPGDDLSFLKRVEKTGEDYGYAEFEKSVDTIIMGRRTYDWVVKEVGFYPHADKTSYILTRTARPTDGLTHFYTGDLRALITKLKHEPGKDIFCDGGAEVVHALLKEDLIDEFIISIIPVLLGDGIRLFKDGRPERVLTLIATKAFDSGLVQLHYKRSADDSITN